MPKLKRATIKKRPMNKKPTHLLLTIEQNFAAARKVFQEQARHSVVFFKKQVSQLKKDIKEATVLERKLKIQAASIIKKYPNTKTATAKKAILKAQTTHQTAIKHLTQLTRELTHAQTWFIQAQDLAQKAPALNRAIQTFETAWHTPSEPTMTEAPVISAEDNKTAYEETEFSAAFVFEDEPA
jgi:hypothetical protein